MRCDYCHWEILPGDLSRVVIDTDYGYPEQYHTACYNYNNWLRKYLNEISKKMGGLVND